MTALRIPRPSVFAILLLAACAHAPASNGKTGAEPKSDGNQASFECLDAKFTNDPNAPKLCTAQCDRGDRQSCTTLGAMYAQGHLVEKADASAVKAYSRGCELGDWLGCYELGAFTKRTDPKTALPAYERVCKLDGDKDSRTKVAEACAFTGTAYFEGVLVAKDAKRAKDDLGKACRLGDVESCNRFEWKPKSR
jgi:TPR repeat protein